MSDDKIINLAMRIPWEDAATRHIRIAVNELDAMIDYTRQAKKSIKEFYDCLGDDSVLAQYEAEFGVTGKKNVIRAALPDTNRARLEVILKEALQDD